MHNTNIEVALVRIHASNAAIQMLLGPTLQAELLTLAVECYQRACADLEDLVIATSRS